MLLRLGFRNLMRNRRRALITGSAIGLGLAALMFSDALVKGMQESLLQSATESFLGDGQLHRTGYRAAPEVEHTIEGLPSVYARMESDDRISALARRVISPAIATSPANLSPVQLYGVEPAAESLLSQVDDAVAEGEFFAGDNPRDLVIGQELAELLEAELGSRIVLTAAQAGTGDLAQEMFRVSGIYRFGVMEMDRGMAFIRLERAQAMVGIDGDAHEVAIKLSPTGRSESSQVWADYSHAGNEAVGWEVLLPQLKAALDLSKFSLLIIGLILFAVVALGIINTLFMSLHERTFEFGVLRAVGTRSSRLALLILAEAAALALLAAVLGIAIGTLTIGLVGKIGIDYTGIEAMGVTFRDRLYPVFSANQLLVYPVIVVLLTVTVALYPAVHAARILPAQALRRSF
jgi:ABC-type lipoprotein release transport system permease subunit